MRRRGGDHPFYRWQRVITYSAQQAATQVFLQSCDWHSSSCHPHPPLSQIFIHSFLFLSGSLWWYHIEEDCFNALKSLSHNDKLLSLPTGYNVDRLCTKTVTYIMSPCFPNMFRPESIIHIIFTPPTRTGSDICGLRFLQTNTQTQIHTACLGPLSNLIPKFQCFRALL